MSSLTDKMNEYLEFLETPEGEESIIEFQKKCQLEDERKNTNIERIKKMFNDQKTFYSFVDRIINKHDESYISKCYKKGYQPYPNNILTSLFDLVEKEGVEISESLDDFTEHFPSDIFQYNGHQFSFTYGQGTCYSIYYNKKIKFRI